jgi:hypothetical protein
MTRIPSTALTSLLLIVLAPFARAEFLVLGIKESTAEIISYCVVAFCAMLIVLALKNSRSKGGQGN